MNVVLLRYFNLLASTVWLTGEDPGEAFQTTGPLRGLRVAVASARLFTSLVTTTTPPDGTGVRDYIHAATLALATQAALKWDGLVAQALKSST